MSSQYQIFEAAKANNLHKVEELLDSGVDPNIKVFSSHLEAHFRISIQKLHHYIMPLPMEVLTPQDLFLA